MDNNNDNNRYMLENDEYCILEAQILLDQYIQAKIIADIIKEETDEEQKEALKIIYQEEKQEFLNAKAVLDKCMFLNGNPNYNSK